MTSSGGQRTGGLRRGRAWVALALASCVGMLVVACSGNDALPPGSAITSARSGDDGGDSADIVVDVTAASIPFDRRLLGTNVPAWIGPERLADPEFQKATKASGVSLLRMPGGSWSNSYDVAGCEVLDPERCDFVDSARPTDFIDFMQATELPGMWTVSINQTAQSAAAAVAFFNGEVGDERVIGLDRNGVDWGTVGSWADLRELGGNPDPQRMELWEVGNEVYGGRPETGGDQCASFGWEDVWTCDGSDYISGDATHDGYLAIRAAMLSVDPNIEVGAVGVSDPAAWSDWGNEVIAGAAGDLDFYVVHAYGFDSSPSGESAVRRPSELWPGVLKDVRNRLDSTIPVAVTEYNLVSFEAGDTEHTMTKAMNALYVADTVGQLAVNGVAIANQWNLANGTTGSGTDYGMISLDDGSRFPQYEAMEMWSRVGSQLLPVEVSDDALRAYATRHEDGRLTLLVLNLSDEESGRTVRLSGTSLSGEGELTSVSTDDLAGTTMSRNSTTVLATAGDVTVTLPSWSVNLLEFVAP